MTPKRLTVATLILACAPAFPAASTPEFSLIDYPDATSTTVWGINPRGEMVGVYIAGGTAHGFKYDRGKFTTIDYPGSALTILNTVNARGDIGGEYATTATGPHHGFLLSSGRFITIDYPGATVSYVVGITPDGRQILGGYSGADALQHTFVLADGIFNTIDYPGAPQTVPGGIGPRGEIVASFQVTGGARAFMQFQGRTTVWDGPAGATFTNALAINASGEIVGRYRDTANVSHGYLLFNGQFTTIDYPGATFTGLTGITADGDVVGRCTLGGVNHGFLASRALNQRYTISDLGTLGGTASAAYSINNSGIAAGEANGASEDQHAVLWVPGGPVDLGNLGGVNATATNYNALGQVSVTSELSSADPNGADFCGWGTHRTCRAAIWKNGTLTPSPTLGGNNGLGLAINDRGVMVGTAERAQKDAACPAPQVLSFAPVLYGPAAAQVTELPVLPGDTVGFALGINNKGEAVGSTGTCDTVTVAGLALGPHAVLWRNGLLINLGTLGVPTVTVAASINDRSEVTGGSSLTPDGSVIHGFLWTDEAGMRDIGVLDGDVSSLPTSISNAGDIVGASCDGDMNCRAFLRTRSGMFDLNDLLPADSPLYVVFAEWINDAGEIAGFAFDQATQLHAFVARPTNAGAPNAIGAPRVKGPNRLREATAKKVWARSLAR